MLVPGVVRVRTGMSSAEAGLNLCALRARWTEEARRADLGSVRPGKVNHTMLTMNERGVVNLKGQASEITSNAAF